MSESTSWHSYPKSLAVGHKWVREIFDSEVSVTEKIDGSQFSFGKFGNDLLVRSKSRTFDIEAPDTMFQRACDTVKLLSPRLKDGWTYRAEYLQKNKHNVLAYDRTPKNYLIIYDINNGHESYLSYDEIKAEAERIGLEVVPEFFRGKVENVAQLHKFLNNTSILGGQKIEGFVIKNYNKIGQDGKLLSAKYVSESFKEVHSNEWKQANPSNKDVLTNLIENYRSPARWQKAIQHLKERGELQGAPQDIPNLIKETQLDLVAECKEEIKEILWKWASKHILRTCTHGLPEFYKQKLLEGEFGDI